MFQFELVSYITASRQQTKESKQGYGRTVYLVLVIILERPFTS